MAVVIQEGEGGNLASSFLSKVSFSSSWVKELTQTSVASQIGGTEYSLFVNKFINNNFYQRYLYSFNGMILCTFVL